jgi:hypothetical protein
MGGWLFSPTTGVTARSQLGTTPTGPRVASPPPKGSRGSGAGITLHSHSGGAPEPAAIHGHAVTGLEANKPGWHRFSPQPAANAVPMLDALPDPASVVDLDAVKIGRLVKKGDPIEGLKALWEAGHLLAQKNASLAHGQWLRWLNTHEQVLGFKERTARRLMDLSKRTLATDLTPEQAGVELAKVWGHDPIKHAKHIRAERLKVRKAKVNADINAKTQDPTPLSSIKKRYPIVLCEARSRSVVSGRGPPPHTFRATWPWWWR